MYKPSCSPSIKEPFYLSYLHTLFSRTHSAFYAIRLWTVPRASSLLNPSCEGGIRMRKTSFQPFFFFRLSSILFSFKDDGKQNTTLMYVTKDWRTVILLRRYVCTMRSIEISRINGWDALKPFGSWKIRLYLGKCLPLLLLLPFFSTGATTHCGFVFCSPLAGL